MKTPIFRLEKDKRRTDPIRSGGTSYPRNRGGYEIYVDGIKWGEIRVTWHGSHGPTYHVAGPTGTNAGIEVDSMVPGKKRMKYFETPGDKRAKRNLKPGEEFVPLEDRLRAIVAKAMTEGALRDPAVVKAEAEKAANAFRVKQAERLQEQNLEFSNRAKEAIGPYAKVLTATAVADLSTRIVEAMKWAQSR